MEKFIFLKFFLLLSAQSSLAQQIGNDEERAEWISNNFINLDNLLGRNGTQDVQDGKPFQTIPQEMADAKVIAFGEAKHGDGAKYSGGIKILFLT